MDSQLHLGDLAVRVVRKEIRNVHLSVHPPTGWVTISAPTRMSNDTLRVFALSKLGWIRRQQSKLFEQEREAPREFLNRESHFVWGRRYLLTVSESDQPPLLSLSHNRMFIRVRPQTDAARKQAFIDEWYRDQIRTVAPPLIAKWERLIDVEVERFFVQRMKTKWGSCNSRARTIRLNTDLAKKPRECLEYLIVHELVHLLEPTHNARFVALMNQFMPKWEHHRETLNQLPVRHEVWSY